MGKNAGAIASIRELCSLGLGSELLIPALLEALHRVIPSARNLFDWVDSDGRILRYYFEGPIDHQAARLYFDEFHNRREAEAMPKYLDVILGDASIRSAEELNNRHFFDSALYQEIWRPQRLHYRLEAIVRGVDRRPLGSLVLYRERGDRIFGRADEQMLQSLLPYITHGLQQAARPGVEYTRGEHRDALVNLDAQGRIVHLSRNAHKVLLLSHGGISPSAAALPPRSEDFPTLVLLHRQATRAHADSEAPYELSLSNDWGRFEFRAERLQPLCDAEPALVGITIQHLVPRAVQQLGRLDGSGLSITQKKVCTLLLQGLTQPQIAARLGVSRNTVVDHTRKIYIRLDVHSVDELRAHFAADDAARA